MIESRDRLLIGVDGGGTGCRVAICDGTQKVLALAEGARANVFTDFDLALENIRKTIALAAEKAGISRDAIDRAVVHMGLAGVVSDAVAKRVAAASKFSHVTVTDDRPTAVAGALAEADGYLVSVGTGTIIARQLDGKTSSVGGYGFYVSDQASAAWLGKRLLETVLKCHDGLSAHSDLTRATLTKFSDDPNQIAAFSIASKPGDYGQFSRDIVAAAQAGDAVGQALIGEGFDYLQAGLVALNFNQDATLCLTGGLGASYRPYFENSGASGVSAPKGTSVSGAVFLASKEAARTVEASS